MSPAALARTSMMSSTGVATRVHPSALARGGQTKGADKRQDSQWASWSDQSWDGAAAAWWSGTDANHEWSSGSGGRGQSQKTGGKRQGQWQWR